MKHKVYGITYAYIHGLTEDYTSNGKNIWNISFNYEERQLPFNNPLQIFLFYSFSLADEQIRKLKEGFSDNNIKDGDKVAVIYDVVSGNVIAIGRNRYDLWIMIDKFKAVSFSRLGIRNCSLIPMFY